MGMGQGQGQGQGQGMGMGQGTMPGPGGPGGEAGGFSTGDGPAVANTERLQGIGEYKESMEGQSVGGQNTADGRRDSTRMARGRAWFTALPMVVRDAVRSSGKTAAPKGYEELLRRYFEDRN